MMVVVPLYAVAVAVDELRDRAALHAHSGPYERHLVCKVAQVPRAQALRYLELRRGLEQEHALAPALVYHVVHGIVPGTYPAHVGTLARALAR